MLCSCCQVSIAMSAGDSDIITYSVERLLPNRKIDHYYNVIMGAMVYQIASLTIVYITVYSGADQRKHQSSVSLAFVRGIHREPVN